MAYRRTRWADRWRTILRESTTARRPACATGLPSNRRRAAVHRRAPRRRVFHKATRRGADGTVLAEIEAEVRFALGSGTRGIAFLIDREGFLFQSPIAWFAQRRRWDVSPGLRRVRHAAELRAADPARLPVLPHQPISAGSRDVEPLQPPIFQGHAIGCERCHGPGELHVNRGGPSTETDLTIVNPAHLAPALRDSVCQQCHLQGTFRFARAGREPLDFRPGLPLHRFWRSS